jgi:asparagine synthase (glutamine-hydrolysing)
MSGIAIVFQRDRRPIRRDEMQRVARALRMYGPERQAAETYGHVGFAYAHLSNTPESRNDFQPMEGGGGRYVMAFDGRLDNREDIARGLNVDPADLADMADSRLAMLAFEKHGRDAPQSWVGEFAFIVWDRQTDAVIAARDYMGLRVLYLHETKDRLVIASAAKAIFALGDVPREVDEQKVADALAQLYFDQPRSFYKGITRLPHAKTVRFVGESRDENTFWSLDRIKPVRHHTDDDYLERGIEVFDAALKAQLRTHKRIGAFLSGGLDSALMVAHASRYFPEPGSLPTYTWVPQDDWDGRIEPYHYGDESPYVEALQRMYPSIATNFISATGKTHYHMQDELLDAVEQPSSAPLVVGWLHDLYERAKEDGVGAIHWGVLGNMSLNWHGTDVPWYWLRRGRFDRFTQHFWNIWSRGDRKHPLQFLKTRIWHDVVGPGAPLHWWQWHNRKTGNPETGPLWQHFSFVGERHAAKHDIAQRAARSGQRFAQGQPDREERLNVLLGAWNSDDGVGSQGLRALHGIEARDPYADRRVVEWSFAVPPDQFARAGELRYFARRWMRRVLPDEIIRRKWTLHGLANCDWHARLMPVLPQMRADIATAAADPTTRDLFDFGKLEKTLGDWPSETVVGRKEPESYLIPTVVPLSLQVLRFVRRERGAND